MKELLSMRLQITLKIVLARYKSRKNSEEIEGKENYYTIMKELDK